MVNIYAKIKKFFYYWFLKANSTLFKGRRAQRASNRTVWNLARDAHRDFGVQAALDVIATYYPALNPVGKADIARFAMNIQAAEIFERERNTAGWRIFPPVEIPALKNAVLLMMVKDEEDIIGQNLRHHYAMGFRQFCILDNASTDATAAIITTFRRDYPQALVTYIYDQITKYVQSKKIIAAEYFSRDYMTIESGRPDWRFCVDADEFISFAGTGSMPGIVELEAALLSKKTRLLVMHWISCGSFTPVAAPPVEDTPFKYLNKVMRWMAPPVSKVAYRFGFDFKPMEGSHFITEYPYALDSIINGSKFGLYLVHFSLRSLKHVRSKVIKGGLALQDAPGREKHSGTWRNNYALYQEHGEAAIEQILNDYIASLD